MQRFPPSNQERYEMVDININIEGVAEVTCEDKCSDLTVADVEQRHEIERRVIRTTFHCKRCGKPALLHIKQVEVPK